MLNALRPVCGTCGKEVVHAFEYLDSLSLASRRMVTFRLLLQYGEMWKEKIANIGYCPNRCGPAAVKPFPLRTFEIISKA